MLRGWLNWLLWILDCYLAGRLVGHYPRLEAQDYACVALVVLAALAILVAPVKVFW